MDSQKAFDKLDHKLTLCELYTKGVDGGLWSVVRDLYEGWRLKSNCKTKLASIPCTTGSLSWWGFISALLQDILKPTSPGSRERKTGDVHRDSICGMSYMC